jgi:hypothetical protein
MSSISDLIEQVFYENETDEYEEEESGISFVWSMKDKHSGSQLQILCEPKTGVINIGIMDHKGSINTIEVSPDKAQDIVNKLREMVSYID